MLANEIRTLGQPEPSAPPAGTLLISPSQAEQIVRAVEGVIKFATDHPIEFHSFCPPSRWQPVLDRVGRMTQSIERQLSTAPGSVFADRDSIMSLLDLEECVTGARDEKLTAARRSLAVSAVGALGATLLGIRWIAVPAYLVSIAIVFGTPALAAAQEELPEPFAISGAALGDHSDKAKLVERVLLASDTGERRFHFGRARNGPGPGEEAICLINGAHRVRVEGAGGLDIREEGPWHRGSPADCAIGRKEIAVWESDSEPPAVNSFGVLPISSGHARSLWVEYVGPRTEGRFRRAGPFG